jgi:hypothetical protein
MGKPHIASNKVVDRGFGVMKLIRGLEACRFPEGWRNPILTSSIFLLLSIY